MIIVVFYKRDFFFFKIIQFDCRFRIAECLWWSFYNVDKIFFYLAIIAGDN